LAVSELPLSDHGIDLWYVFLDKIADSRLLDEYRSHLPREEVDREQRYAFEESRLQFLVARILVRSVLSHDTGDDLRAWDFTENKYGKPKIASPAGVALDFNLSHTRGLVICGVTLGRPVGVDAEELSRAPDALALARRFFAPAEADLVESLPPEQQREAFLELWTLKEAFIKARGMGLAHPLGQFAFSLAEDRPPAISFTGRGGQDPSDWQFAQLRLGPRHQIALAVELPASQRLEVRVRATVPLRSHEPGRVLAPSRSNTWYL
jgi:4'-phosphopantetheinyl transferase